ncbi:MAG TPA: CaiB/BaiF CoA-transferase family protein [Candidatus Sulfotelmatobacter sp.]|nr:CaiB/BaiF CoA-transferase family protein [Candidatus Sulfotelmatobacter sp.]
MPERNSQTDATKPGAERPRGPLAGITVIDLSRILAGPYCTHLMAELGARVIKVETPGKGDDAREYGPFREGKSTYFASVNRGKESIALDLKAPADKRIFEALLGRADVLVENFRPGTMEKLGYGWEALHQRYPRLIYAAASGFGHTGPFANHPAYDMVVQGLGGIMSITGEPGRPPVRVGTSIGDIGSGLYAAIAVNAALLHRERSGEASKVDIAMFDCQIALLENAVMRYTVTGEIPGPLGARHPSITPFEAFATADGSMIIAAGNDGLWRKLCEVLKRPDLAADPGYKTNDLRNRNQAKLKVELEKELRRKPTAEWIGIIEAAGLPCGPINNVAGALAHPQVEARNMLVTVEDPAAGTLKLAGNPLKFSAFADPTTRPPAPDLDADRAKILRELGLE